MTGAKVRVSDVFDRWGVTIGLFIVVGAIVTTALESIRDKLVIDVALDHGSNPYRAIPRGFGPAYRRYDRHAVVYALRPLHWILHAAHVWHWQRWCIEVWLFSIGWMEGDHEEAPTFKSLRYGNPARIILARIETVRSAGRAAREYARKRAEDEGFEKGFLVGRCSLMKEVTELRDDVAALRRDLETRPAEPVPLTPGLVALEQEAERTR